MEPPSHTKEKILDAAERLLARNGMSGTSLRGITAEAGVNLAAVNYHFTSKDSLIRAVIRRRLGPVNQRRLELLAAAEARAGGAPVPPEEISRAFLEPVVAIGDQPAGRSLTSALIGRLYHESTPDLLRHFTAELRTVAERFTAAYRHALPQLPADELLWRFHFMVGGMAHTLAAAHVMEALCGGGCDTADLGAAIRRLTAFVSAGFSAPPLRKGKDKSAPSAKRRRRRR